MTQPPNVPPNVPGQSSLPPSGAAGGMQGMPPTTPPPARSGGGLFTGRNIIIGLIGLGLLCACACAGIFITTGGAIGTIFSQVAQPAAVGTEFMQRLKDGDWNRAYALCTPELQRELGSAQQLGQRVTNGKAQPTSWTFDNTNLRNDRLELTGTGNFAGGRSGTVELVIDKTGNDWKIAGFNLQPK